MHAYKIDDLKMCYYMHLYINIGLNTEQNMDTWNSIGRARLYYMLAFMKPHGEKGSFYEVSPGFLNKQYSACPFDICAHSFIL